MDFREALMSRKSVRSFQKSLITKDKIEELLMYASFAPYPKIEKNWETKYFYGDNKNIVNKMLLQMLQEKKDIGNSTFNSIKNCIKAPVIIFVFTKYFEQAGISMDKRLLNHSFIQATGAFIQNILLCATDMGLGSLWVNDVLYFAAIIEKELKAESKLVSAVILGYEKKH